MTSLNIGDALGYSILGFAIVFVVLIVLWIIISIMAKILNVGSAKSAEAAAAPAAPAPVKEADPAPGAAGELMLKNVSERDAAMIMAIVADKLQKPLNELRFKSITEVDDDEV